MVTPIHTSYDKSDIVELRESSARMISVIVPVYRDWNQATELLAALKAQTWRDFEVILVNNEPESSVNPDNLPHPGVALSVIDCAKPGSYAARNMGASQASGQILAFTDADCLPVEEWLQALAEGITPSRDEILIGPVELVAACNPNDWEIFDTVRGMRQEVFIRHGYGVTANLALRAAVFKRLNGFDETRLSGGDAEFCRRATRDGVSLQFIHAAQVRHPARSSRAQIETKARRIKGGQVGVGPFKRRLGWGLRSLSPPIREMFAYIREARYPVRWRIKACRIRLYLWGVELREIYNLIVLRNAPERR
jgi:glycosyltransferase involved in cell wall biosynthesis